MRNLMFTLFIFLVMSMGHAGVSLITGAVIVGGDKVQGYDLKSSLDRIIRNVSMSVAKVCTLTEHFIFERGISFSTLSSQSTRKVDFVALYEQY